MKSPEIPGVPPGPTTENLLPKHNVEGAIENKWKIEKDLGDLIQKKGQTEGLIKMITHKQEKYLGKVAELKTQLARYEVDAMRADLSENIKNISAGLATADSALLNTYNEEFNKYNTMLVEHRNILSETTSKITELEELQNKTRKTLDSQLPKTDEEAEKNYWDVDNRPIED